MEALLSRFGQSAFRSAHAFEIGAFGPGPASSPASTAGRGGHTDAPNIERGGEPATCPTRMAE